jgi:heat-inducible transcriptional repressor
MSMKQDAPLTERQKDILQAVVNTHITTASAVGSRTVAKKMAFRLSPASIRNVMADLEDMGYVRQPHTSAGRVPTDIGYRVYVNDLMDIYKLALDELNSIEELLEPGVGEVEELMGLASHLLSLLSQYTAVVQTPKAETETIKHVELISLSADKLLVILVTNLGEVRKRLMVKSTVPVDEDTEKLAAFLNQKFCALSFEAARSLLESYRNSSAPAENALTTFAVEAMEGLFTDEAPREVYLGGMENIFSQPEFQDVERLRPVLRVLDQKRQLNQLLEKLFLEDMTPSVCIRIGSENPVDDIRNCSIIASPYRIGGKMMGAVCVIGPTRMQYARASSLVAVIANKLGHVLSILSGGE